MFALILWYDFTKETAFSDQFLYRNNSDEDSVLHIAEDIWLKVFFVEKDADWDFPWKTSLQLYCSLSLKWINLHHSCTPILLRHTVDIPSLSLSLRLSLYIYLSLSLSKFEIETVLIACGLFTLSLVCFQERYDYALKIHNNVINRNHALKKTVKFAVVSVH